MSKNENLSHDSWLQTFYEEAWRQHAHENELSQTRNTFFLTVETALLGIFSGITVLFIGLNDNPQTPSPFPILALGFMSIFIGAIGYIIAANWKSANRAGRAYLHMRWATVRAIEIITNHNEFSPGNIQQIWSEKSREKNAEERIKLFTEIAETKIGVLDETILQTLREIDAPRRIRRPKGMGEGWGSTERTTNAVQVLFGLISVVGASAIISGVIFALQPSPTSVPISTLQAAATVVYGETATTEYTTLQSAGTYVYHETATAVAAITSTQQSSLYPPVTVSATATDTP